jgi:hypothetical protein
MQFLDYFGRKDSTKEGGQSGRHNDQILKKARSEAKKQQSLCAGSNGIKISTKD